LRGYSGKATKWVDFVMTDSTRRESCHSLKLKRKRGRVKGDFGQVEIIDFMEDDCHAKIQSSSRGGR
jgi:hypothetical protein